MTHPRRIQVLPETLVSKIAAGEVIERPASIVKELIENAIDANATQINISLVAGGKKEIIVTDNGSGIPADQVRLAVERHSTSKISTFDDLTQIQTFGFRGEALSSIASVSHFRLLSRAHGQEEGVGLRVDGGILQSAEPCGMPIGTSVSVANLFYNTPARKKFLKSNSTELGHIESVVWKSALSQLSISFILESEGELILNLPKASSLIERVSQRLDKEAVQKLVSIEASDLGMELTGVISNSHLSYSRADNIFFFVNGRVVKDRILLSAMMEGYRTALMERSYPYAVVHLKINPDLVDVNVHPTKSEVRFANSQPIFQLMSRTIAGSLSANVTKMVSSPTPYSPLPSSGDQSGFSELLATAALEPALPYLASTSKGPFESLETLGVLDGTFWILKDATSLFLIDQHAAHERVRFEELKEQSKRSVPDSQKLLIPLTLELSKQQSSTLEAVCEALKGVGYEIEPFGENSWVIKATPAVIRNGDPRLLVVDLLNSIISEEGDAPLRDRLDHIISTLACHSAVRAHDRLSKEEMEALLKRMDEIDLASNCPHGRPTFIKLGLSDIERMFRRK